MFNSQDTVKEVMEFANNHHTIIFLSPSLHSKVFSSEYVEIKLKDNTQFYEISLPSHFSYESEIRQEWIKYNYEPAKIYAALCLQCLFKKTSVYFIINSDGSLPQIEWYVKNNNSNDIVESSHTHIYVGGDYFASNSCHICFYNSDTIIAKSESKTNFRLLTTKTGGNLVTLYGYSIKEINEIYTLPLSEIELQIQKNTYPPFCKLNLKGTRALYLDRYDFLTNKLDKLKYYLIGVNEIND